MFVLVLKIISVLTLIMHSEELPEAISLTSGLILKLDKMMKKRWQLCQFVLV